MNDAIPRLRMFAGPNGSGKSTLKSYLAERLLGVYLNPDEIEHEIRTQGSMDFTALGVSPAAEKIKTFFAASSLLENEGFEQTINQLGFRDGRIEFGKVAVNAYFASVVVELLRRELLAKKTSFTFETVMSHRSKVNFLEEARQNGYRTYLYFVATDDPAINISRVRNRVRLGGHSVPEQKIVERYYRSLELLPDAIRQTNRAYIFDNSGDSEAGKQTWLAEITDGARLELKTGHIPAWFRRAVLDKVAL